MPSKTAAANRATSSAPQALASAATATTRSADVGACVASHPQGCTNLKLRQLTRRIGHVYDQALAQSGLKITQYSLLSHVVRLGPLRSADLAAALRMEASTLSRNLRPLMAAGWVELQPGEDARTHAVIATAAGRAKRAEAQLRWKAAQRCVNQLLGDELVVRLHAQLDAALARLEADGAGGMPAGAAAGAASGATLRAPRRTRTSGSPPRP
ncbi:MAG: winged helix-turn-helix transcriptional regulator [Rubrivivax sp.]|nr:winged helix-turn-helix transcriptional regulator [Rubrivivax sp.]